MKIAEYKFVILTCLAMVVMATMGIVGSIPSPLTVKASICGALVLYASGNLHRHFQEASRNSANRKVLCTICAVVCLSAYAFATNSFMAVLPWIGGVVVAGGGGQLIENRAHE